MHKFKGVKLKHKQCGPIHAVESLAHEHHDNHARPLKLTELTRDIIRERIERHGVVGMGGGGFATHLKCQPEQIQTAILNGVECDLGIYCDSALMQTRTAALFEGIAVLKVLWPDARYVMAVKQSDTHAIAALQKYNSAIELQTFPDRYPMGAESLLVKSIAGVDVSRGSYPLEHGIVCFNVSTVCALRDAVLDDKPLSARIITVSGGLIPEARHVRVDIGTRVADLLNSLTIAYQDAELFEGGVFMHEVITPDHRIQKTTTAIRVELRQHHEAQPCIRCGDCADVCPENLLPQSLYWHIQAGHLEKAQALRLDACMECNACAIVCPSHIPLVDHYRAAKSTLKEERRLKEKAALAKAQFEAKAARVERKQALKDVRRETKLKQAKLEDKKALIQQALARAQAKKDEANHGTND